ncbi:MAG: UvrD-helicase domain-containing protein [Tannerella sp.]|jgi:ATP-dependent exoDNAse (exonuclease V) beta subunit|nr:UvrD-helicase domain-containing protein [Tannerella sp.]
MLTIYRASAGTGKTHTLTGEYLKLLFKGKEVHKRILSVTFTNKATAEMKKRIIDELFNLADNRKSNYISMLSEFTKQDEMTVRIRAREVLLSILHDYSSFNISTIDHFFQRTVRAFAREIGLQGNYRLELDETQMMEESVDNMLSGIEKAENKELMEWLLSFAEDKIEEGEGWDFHRDILDLGSQLFKETYKIYSAQIQEETHQKQFLAEYRENLYKIVQATRNKARELGETGKQLLENQGLQPSDLFNGSRSPFFFFGKLATGIIEEPSETFKNLADNPDGYTAKKASPVIKAAAESLYENGMNNLISSVIHFFENLTDYYTAQAILKNFYALGILTDLSEHIAQWREENNKMFISDTTELLHKVIDGSDVPFIYEKTGTWIEHYMIDEFQDTSKMQWANFKPLVKDSLDSGRSNLIVGDVKQSIYRFRNSDWTLLSDRLVRDFPHRIREEDLDVNWRSFRSIVEFNNMIFSRIPRLLQQSYNQEIAASSLPEASRERNYTVIEDAYTHVEQAVAKPFTDKLGYVKIQFLEDTDGEEGEKIKWDEQSLEFLPLTIEELQKNGYELRDIAILTRTGAEGLQAAERLLAYRETHPDSPYKYDIITEDSLTINSSLSVRWAIAMLKYIHQPDVESNRSIAQMAFAMLRRKKSDKNTDNLLNTNDLFSSLNEQKIQQLKQLSHRSLYELAEGIFRFYDTEIPENELVFVQAFLDTVAEYSMNETADTGHFLQWWNEKGFKKKIVTPDTQNAIRIMTVHKSKGLGFKVVILPFADWKMDQKDSFLWCRPTQKPFDRMSLVPVKYHKDLKNTYFAEDYFHEKLHAYMDNLNTLYVAFTRAKEELIVVAPKPKSNPKGNTDTVSVATLLYESIKTDAEFFNEETGIYERGEHPGFSEAKKNDENTDIEEIMIQKFRFVSPDERLQLRLDYDKNL